MRSLQVDWRANANFERSLGEVRPLLFKGQEMCMSCWPGAGPWNKAEAAWALGRWNCENGAGDAQRPTSPQVEQ